MLNNVPLQTQMLAHRVVVRHPNSMTAVLYRKRSNRTDPLHSGNPTMGGLAVLSSTDEEDYTYDRKGIVAMLPVVDRFAPSVMQKSMDVSVGDGNIEARYLIVSIHDSAHPEYVKPKDHDIVFVLMTGEEDGPKFAFEIVKTETTLNVPPFTERYVLNRREDLLENL